MVDVDRKEGPLAASLRARPTPCRQERGGGGRASVTRRRQEPIGWLRGHLPSGRSNAFARSQFVRPHALLCAASCRVATSWPAIARACSAIHADRNDG